MFWLASAIKFARPADSDTGDIEQVARRRHAATENVTRYDHETCAADCGVLDEIAARDAIFFDW